MNIRRGIIFAYVLCGTFFVAHIVNAVIAEALSVPGGLVRTELLRGRDRQWRIQTLWRDRAALDAMRSAPEPPAAPNSFRRVGAIPC